MRTILMVVVASAIIVSGSENFCAYAGNDNQTNGVRSPIVATLTNGDGIATSSSSSSASVTDVDQEELSEEALIRDEETALHKDTVELVTQSQPEEAQANTVEQQTLTPTTKQEYWGIKLQLLKERNQMLAEISKSLASTAILQAAKKKEQDDKKQRLEEAKKKMEESSEAMKSMYS